MIACFEGKRYKDVLKLTDVEVTYAGNMMVVARSPLRTCAVGASAHQLMKISFHKRQEQWLKYISHVKALEHSSRPVASLFSGLCMRILLSGLCCMPNSAGYSVSQREGRSIWSLL